MHSTKIQILPGTYLPGRPALAWGSFSGRRVRRKVADIKKRPQQLGQHGAAELQPVLNASVNHPRLIDADEADVIAVDAMHAGDMR